MPYKPLELSGRNMKKLIYISASVLMILFYGCQGEELPAGESSYNASVLRSMVNEAVSGKKESNAKLHDLVDLSLPGNKNYSKLLTDSVRVGNKTFLYVLLEYANPIYSRFAVYDKDLNPLLIDKSLNGNLAFEFVSHNNDSYIRIVESFLSKDIINLKRLSLYKTDTSSVRLVYRSFISMMTPEAFISQEVDTLTNDYLITEIMLTGQFSGVAPGDTFYFDKKGYRYLSSANRFDSLVRNQVRLNTAQSTLPEITDKNSVNKLLHFK